jgi:hypothetical protein
MRLFLPLPGTRNWCPALAAIGWRGCAGDVTGTGAELELGTRKVGIGERIESCFLERFIFMRRIIDAHMHTGR